MAKNTGKVREFCQSGKVGTLIDLFKLCLDRAKANAKVKIFFDVCHLFSACSLIFLAFACEHVLKLVESLQHALAAIVEWHTMYIYMGFLNLQLHFNLFLFV